MLNNHYDSKLNVSYTMFCVISIYGYTLSPARICSSSETNQYPLNVPFLRYLYKYLDGAIYRPYANETAPTV